MISIKTEKELEVMRQCGTIAATCMEKVLHHAKPGVSKAELDKLAEAEIKKLGGQLSFTTVPGYNFATCITVNSEVVHGIPGNYILKAGDLVSVDLGVVLSGLHTDMARTIYLGNPNEKIKKFLKVGETALGLGVKQAQVGKRVENISAVIQETIEAAGFTVVKSLVGHGIGYKLHEDPQVPGFVTGEAGPELTRGMTLAIEVIYTEGGSDVRIKEDGWTVVTRNGKRSALFEDTVAITTKGPVILTSKN